MARGNSPSNSQARIQGEAIGRGRWESSLLEHPGAKFFRKNRFLTEKEKEAKSRTKKGDISNELRKGTFLLSFDTCAALALTRDGGGSIDERRSVASEERVGGRAGTAAPQGAVCELSQPARFASLYARRANSPALLF